MRQRRSQQNAGELPDAKRGENAGNSEHLQRAGQSPVLCHLFCLEAEGYCKWPRLKETVELCKKMNYHRIGLAFCKGLRKEARVVANLLREQKFEVVSVICKTGGYPKEAAGISRNQKIHPEQFEAMCNPIAQAELLNSQNTDFNIALGLCVGHDSLFYKYSEALVTTLVAKDRVLAHNLRGDLLCRRIF